MNVIQTETAQMPSVATHVTVTLDSKENQEDINVMVSKPMLSKICHEQLNFEQLVTWGIYSIIILNNKNV